MDDRRRPGVEEMKAFEYLTAPAPQDLDLHHLKALQVPARITRKRSILKLPLEIYCILKGIFLFLKIFFFIAIYGATESKG